MSAPQVSPVAAAPSTAAVDAAATCTTTTTSTSSTTAATGLEPSLSSMTVAPNCHTYIDLLPPSKPEDYSSLARIQALHDCESCRSYSLTAAAAAAAAAAAYSAPPPEEERLEHAAELIQRTYRGYRTRRQINGMTISASSRFVSTVRDAQFRSRMNSTVAADGSMSPTNPGSENAASRWRLAGAVLQRAGQDVNADSESDSDSDSDSSSSSSSYHEGEASTPAANARREEKRRKRQAARERHKEQAMTMNISYFLEMVDAKHRYGGNLLVYHDEWKRADTTENFFTWLDHGEGKDLDLESCPRERLNRECVRYLTREERQFYLVKFDKDGRLLWAKNNQPINTTEEYRDSVEGVVPIDDPAPSYAPGPNTTLVPGAIDTSATAEDARRHSISSSSSSAGSIRHSPRSSASDDDDDEGHRRYPNPVLQLNKDGSKPSKTRHFKHAHFSTTAILTKLMRKSIRKNTWIFVADMRNRLYVGIKMSGTFQHSSFLQGSRIAAAGLIQVKDGRLTSLSPLSGHYRPPASNYKHFVKSLKAEGVDLSHLKISKAYVILASMETYVKTKAKGKRFVQRLTGHKPADEDGVKTK